ncbi:unnamed protein product [Onchocerca flexuosa]|uniref:Uncharacterized protein n=1 Tax=Onchocerca flexuosa TaxID=387005 RepID=A0A183HFL4_9BILA|nr:unnamed protein product [Onchocerca flexuosa]
MPRGALRQVQNISTDAMWKGGELKRSKTITTNAKAPYDCCTSKYINCMKTRKDGNEQNGAKTENWNLKRTLVNIEENLNETKVRKVELLHESSNTVEDGKEQNGAKTESRKLKRILVNIEENLNERKVLELLHESPNTVEVFFV